MNALQDIAEAGAADIGQGPSAALLVSHGQPGDPEIAEMEMAHLRTSVAALLSGWTIASATLAKPGAVAAALARIGDAPLVFPVFMTDGWFTQTALPAPFEGTTARFLKPLGVDPALPDLATHWLDGELTARTWRAADTCLVIAAHGSGRSRNPARDTLAFADVVQARMGFGEIRVGFVEEAPFLVDVLSDAGTRAICLPFFATRRGHVLEDLPDALKTSGFAGPCLDPIGLHPDIPTLIARALKAAVSAR